MYYTSEALKKYKRRAMVINFLEDLILFLVHSRITWFLTGYMLSSVTLIYVLTDAFNQIDKLLVCK